MLHKTAGVVLRMVKYGETSAIVTIFTQVFGLQSYLVNGIRSPKANKIALYQPMTLLDMVVYHHENRNIQRIKEVRCLRPYSFIHADVRKSTILMFINEVLIKSLKEGVEGGEVFDQVYYDLVALDDGLHQENFPIIFLLRLSRNLGIGIYKPEDLEQFMTDRQSNLLTQLMFASYGFRTPMDRQDRSDILDLLVAFYQLHFGSGDYKSLPVLRELLIS